MNYVVGGKRIIKVGKDEFYQQIMNIEDRIEIILIEIEYLEKLEKKISKSQN